MAGKVGLNSTEGLKALGIDTSTFLQLNNYAFRRYAPLAQLVELLTLNHQVDGSKPSWRTRFARIAKNNGH